MAVGSHRTVPQLSIYHSELLGGNGMLKNLIVLPDGTEIFSGEGTVNAVQKVTLTQQVNSGRELTLGSACANMLEATLITPEGGLTIQPGTELTLYKVAEDGSRTKVGLFTAERPTRPSKNAYKIVAYDRISWLDRDLTDWLQSLNGWPYSLYTFAAMVCAACNLTLVNDAIPNGDWQIQRFSAGRITGRQLIQWVGQACGRFCRATADGALEFAWYTPREITLTPDGELPIVAGYMEDYRTAPIDKVQIRLTEKDVGAVYGTGGNAYCITGNYLLTTDALASLQEVAQVLYNTLESVIYTPCKVKIPANRLICPGDILSVTDRNGRTVPVYVMKKVQTGPWEVLECTGSAYRDSTTVTNNTKLTALSGSVLELQMSMEGIRTENRRADGRMAALELSVDGLKTDVKNQSVDLEDVVTRVTSVEQTAEGLSLQVKSVKNDGVSKVSTATGYTFDETGMTVEKSGREIKTQITEDGMRVYKNKKAVLTASSEGVDAVDLHASTYLIVGGRSRFENYGADRTGCFWIGG